MKKALYITVFTLILWNQLLAQKSDLTTYYERSGYLETPGYFETIEFCRLLDETSAEITYTTFGRSSRGKDLPMLIIDKEGLVSPEAIKARGRLIVLIQACIHPGECEGKDAGLLLARNLIKNTGTADNRAPGKELLDNISIIFLPVFNVDGHERFGPYNRINQNGPKEMGWRTTAQNLNLNRDFLKADAPEMKAWLTMFNHWLPDFFIDTHTTDGADYQYLLTYAIEIFGNMDKELTRWCKENFIPVLQETMSKSGKPIFPYVGFRNWHDPRSGLISEAAPPMLSQGYTAMRNRPGLLIETHMLKPYRQRVNVTYDCILISLDILSREKDKYTELVSGADAFAASPAFLREPFPLAFKTSMTDSIMTDFLGFEYSIEKSDLTGGDWFHYTDKPVTFSLPYFTTARPTRETQLPLAYIVPSEWQSVIERLRLHGIKMTQTESEINIPVKTTIFSNPKWQQNPYEGRHPLLNVDIEEKEQEITFPAGSVIVETSQPAARIIAHLLEPKGNGSLLYWGFFDAVFEQKEYGESYVIEKVAREMIAKDPKLGLAFEEKKKSDSNFAKSQWDMINWFYNRSAWADPKRMVYPVGKLDNDQVLRELLHR
jgi:hypothetical protein